LFFNSWHDDRRGHRRTRAVGSTRHPRPARHVVHLEIRTGKS
jgi:hypothetical protein